MAEETDQRLRVPGSFLAFLACVGTAAVVVQLPLTAGHLPVVRIGVLALALILAAISLWALLHRWLDARTLAIAASLLAVGLSIVLLVAHPARVLTYRASDDTVTDADGLYAAETDPSGTTFHWTTPRATFVFDTGVRHAALMISVRSAAIAGGADEPIHVFANGA